MRKKNSKKLIKYIKMNLCWKNVSRGNWMNPLSQKTQLWSLKPFSKFKLTTSNCYSPLQPFFPPRNLTEGFDLIRAQLISSCWNVTDGSAEVPCAPPFHSFEFSSPLSTAKSHVCKEGSRGHCLCDLKVLFCWRIWRFPDQFIRSVIIQSQANYVRKKRTNCLDWC